MGKIKAQEESAAAARPPEPVISYKRSVKLSIDNYRSRITLAHLEEFIRLARLRGYEGDATVWITEMRNPYGFRDYNASITVGDEN
jgi:hypothetical protein